MSLSWFGFVFLRAYYSDLPYYYWPQGLYTLLRYSFLLMSTYLPILRFPLFHIHAYVCTYNPKLKLLTMYRPKTIVDLQRNHREHLSLSLLPAIDVPVPYLNRRMAAVAHTHPHAARSVTIKSTRTVMSRLGFHWVSLHMFNLGA